jgi:hypothetical protein
MSASPPLPYAASRTNGKQISRRTQQLRWRQLSQRAALPPEELRKLTQAGRLQVER